MEEKIDVKKIILLIFIVCAVLGVFYALTVFITNNKKDENKETETSSEETVIDYDKILVQDIYSQNSESYYVLATTADDEGLFDEKIDNYTKKDNSDKVYYIDLSSAFNKNYVKAESSFEDKYPTFSESTLLKIENKQIIEHYSGKDKIDAYLDTLSNGE